MFAWYHLTTVFPVLIGCMFYPLLSPLIPTTAMQRCCTGDAEGSEDAARAHGVQRQGDGVWQHVQLLRVGLRERGCRCDSVPACATLSVRILDYSCLWVDYPTSSRPMLALLPAAPGQRRLKWIRPSWLADYIVASGLLSCLIGSEGALRSLREGTNVCHSCSRCAIVWRF